MLAGASKRAPYLELKVLSEGVAVKLIITEGANLATK